MTYSPTQVEQGRELVAAVSRNKWDLGDLALTVLEGEMARFAQDIDIDLVRLTSYRNIASVFPPTKRRPEVCWAVHREFATADDPIALLHERTEWTTRTARAHLGRVHQHRPEINERPTSRVDRVALIREALADEDAMTEVFADSESSLRASRAQRRAAVETHEARQRDWELRDPKAKEEYEDSTREIHKTGHDLELEALIGQMRLLALRVAEHRASGTGGEFMFGATTRAAIDTVVNVMTALRDGGGGVTLDQALQDILTEQR